MFWLIEEKHVKVINGNMKQCKIEGCSNSVWSNSVCKNHIPRKPLAQTKGFTAKKSTRVTNDEMRSFFIGIWNKRRHNCENCGKSLGNEPLSYMFDHLLEKSKYPELKYENDNIMIVCLECHDNKTRGFISDLIKIRIEKVKNKFGK